MSSSPGLPGMPNPTGSGLNPPDLPSSQGTLIPHTPPTNRFASLGGPTSPGYADSVRALAANQAIPQGAPTPPDRPDIDATRAPAGGPPPAPPGAPPPPAIPHNLTLPSATNTPISRFPFHPTTFSHLSHQGIVDAENARESARTHRQERRAMREADRG